MMFCSLDTQTKRLTFMLVLMHNIFSAVAFPFSGAFSCGLRTVGDMKFTTIVLIISTIAVRLFLSYVFGIILDMGVIGIAAEMIADWIIRAAAFILREKTEKWKECRVI